MLELHHNLTVLNEHMGNLEQLNTVENKTEYF